MANDSFFNRPAGQTVVGIGTLLSGVGGLLFIFDYIGIKSKDWVKIASNPFPHSFSLIAGLTLFAFSIGGSIWTGIVQRIEIRRLRSTANGSSDERYEDAKLSLERLARINDLESDTVFDTDPLIYPEFVDARWTTGSNKKEFEAYFSLVNRGSVEALCIILEPIKMGERIVQFTRHRIAAALLPKQAAYFYPDVVTKENGSVPEHLKDLFHLFCLDYLALKDSTICEATIVLTATYQDIQRNLFEVKCELVFDPGAHANVRIGQRGPEPVITTRNYRFRKVAAATKLSEAS
jgi:hypothetical protein